MSVTTITTVGAYTYVAGTDIVNSAGYYVIRAGTQTGPFTDTLPSAASLITAFIGSSSATNNGQSFSFTIFNSTAYVNTLTVGTGTSFQQAYNYTLLSQDTVTFTCVQTSATTVTMYAGANGSGTANNAVLVATTANIGGATPTYSNGTAGVGATITNAGVQAAITIDGVSLAVGDRVLVKNQNATLQNGIYSVTNIGSGSTNWIIQRTTDYNLVPQMNTYYQIPVSSGTVNAGTFWFQTATVATIGTSSITFANYIPIVALTGDATASGPGSAALTLATVNTNTGTWGSATQSPQFTVNGKGLITAVSNVTITGTSPVGSSLTSANIWVGNASNLAAAVGVTGDITLSNAGATALVATSNTTLTSLANLATVGTITTGTWSGTNISLAKGGTNASLTASNGGIFYSTATAGAILSGTATANQVLLSGSSAAPTWSSATYPATTTSGQLLYSSANNIVGGLSTTASAILTSSSGSAPTWTALTTNGQLLIGGASGPTAATLTAGNGVSITNGSGSITISSAFSGYTTTATAAGTTTLTVSSTYQQFFTGTTTQTVVMPVTSTLVLGQQWNIVNTSTGSVTIQSSGTNTIIILPANTEAFLTCILLTGTTAASWAYSTAVYSSPSTAGQILIANATANTAPTWSSATYPNTTTSGQLLYSSASNTVSGLATANSGVLVTSSTGVPSWSSTMTNGQLIIGSTGATPVAASLTAGTGITITPGAGSISIALSTPVSLANGGTNASLTASNGGIFYSTASAGAILAGTATANQVLLSGSSAAPTWSSATYPATTTASQLLYSSSSNIIAGLATANSGVLVTSSAGVPSWSSTMTNGQLIIGSTGATPTAATLTAGSGISITNAAGSITIAASASTSFYAYGPTSSISIAGTVAATTLGSYNAAVVTNAAFTFNASTGVVTFGASAAGTYQVTFTIQYSTNGNSGSTYGGFIGQLLQNASVINGSVTGTFLPKQAGTNLYASVTKTWVIVAANSDTLAVQYGQPNTNIAAQVVQNQCTLSIERLF